MSLSYTAIGNHTS